MSRASPLRCSRIRRRAFTLIELMIVVVIVGVIAALAIPSMRLAIYDRHAFDDAGAAMQLLRSARSRAVARGAAVLVEMSASGATNRGTFTVYESVQANPDGSGNATPVSSCKSPTVWTLTAASTTARLVDALNLNGSPEADADIETSLKYYNNGSGDPTVFTDGFVCFTPLGHSYASIQSGSGALPDFTASAPNLSPIEVLVTRSGGATGRSVLLLPNGVARMFSHT